MQISWFSSMRVHLTLKPILSMFVTIWEKATNKFGFSTLKLTKTGCQNPLMFKCMGILFSCLSIIFQLNAWTSSQKISILLNNLKSIHPTKLKMWSVPIKSTIPVILHYIWCSVVLKQKIRQVRRAQSPIVRKGPLFGKSTQANFYPMGSLEVTQVSNLGAEVV